MPEAARLPVIVSAARTPIGKFLGGLSALQAPELGAIAIRAAIQRAKIDPADVEEVILGNVIQGGVGQAPARQAALKAGIPSSVSAMTINKVCGSGLKAVMLAAQAIKAGDREGGVAGAIGSGGQESLSNARYYVYGMRNGVKLGDQQMIDGMIKDGLWCAFCDVHMGGHAEYTAKKAGVTRQMQDEFAAESHRKAVAAQEAGKFKAEIAPVEIKSRKGSTVVDTDESPRKDSTADSLGKLRPAVAHEAVPANELSVTAGNASSLNDGGAALVVTSAAFARE